jgi:hypothetical protein
VTMYYMDGYPVGEGLGQVLRRIWCRFLWGPNHPYRRISLNDWWECPVCHKTIHRTPYRGA